MLRHHAPPIRPRPGAARGLAAVLAAAAIALVSPDGLSANSNSVTHAPTQVHYGPPASAQSRDLRRALMDARYLEILAEALDAEIRLPRSLMLSLQECVEPSAFYDPATTSIVVCYGLVPAIAEDLSTTGLRDEALERAVWNVIAFTWGHEIGHALVDILDLPVSGREEDAVDQLSAYALIDSGKEGVAAALDGAAWFGVRSHSNRYGAAFWDTHSVEEQRYFNLVCWVYGSDPDAHAELPETHGLPLERAMSCPREYQQLVAAWDRMIAPYLVKPKGSGKGAGAR
jgi:hypothetical protein